jgi:energy-coupling factor transport system ATP-binding protein
MVEHRVEDVLRIRPDRILYMKDGAISYLGGVDGLMNVVDTSEIKLPAEMIIEPRAQRPASGGDAAPFAAAR